VILTAVVLPLVVACSSGDRDPTTRTLPAVLLETVDFVSAGRGCRAEGTLLNRTADSTFEVTLHFHAEDFEHHPLGDAHAFIENVPPQARVSYRTTTFGDGTIACTRIVYFHTDDSNLRCTSGSAPGCP
jgi:hypothetical protein